MRVQTVKLAALLEILSEFASLRRFRKPGFFQNLVVVMSGTAIAQFVSFGFSPVLSRLFTPADFGVFGAYFVIAGVIGVAATLNYTDALMLPKVHEDAAPLFLFSCASTLAITLATAVLCMITPAWCLKLLGITKAGWCLALLPIWVLLLGLTECLTAWCSRMKAFRKSSQAQVVRSSSACVTQAMMGIGGAGGLGLVSAAIVAEAASVTFLCHGVSTNNSAVIRKSARWTTIWCKAQEYREFALYGCPRNVINALSQGIPVMVLAHFYGAAVAGSYAFGMRLLQAPMNLVLTAIRQVLFQKMSQLSANGEDLYGPFLKSTIALLFLGFIPSCCAMFVAPYFFTSVFGDAWREAGEFARWLILWLAIVFCNVPSVLVARVLRLQRELFIFDLVLLSTRSGALILGGRWFSSLQTVIGLSIVGALFNFIFILYVGFRLRRHSFISTSPS